MLDRSHLALLHQISCAVRGRWENLDVNLWLKTHFFLKSPAGGSTPSNSGPAPTLGPALLAPIPQVHPDICNTALWGALPEGRFLWPCPVYPQLSSSLLFLSHLLLLTPPLHAEIWQLSLSVSWNSWDGSAGLITKPLCGICQSAFVLWPGFSEVSEVSKEAKPLQEAKGSRHLWVLKFSFQHDLCVPLSSSFNLYHHFGFLKSPGSKDPRTPGSLVFETPYDNVST